MRRQNRKGQRKQQAIVYCLLLAAFLFGSVQVALAAGPDSNPVTHWDTRYNYFLRFPAAAQHGIRSQHNPHGGHDVVEDQRSMGPGTVVHGPGPVFSWPVTIPTAVSQVPTFRDEAIQENLFETFGYPVSDTQFQVIERYNQNRFLEQLYDPEKVMWMSTSMAGVMANSAGNSSANMGINQCINAIDYVRQPLGNFTAEEGNVWQRIRYELFIPMAVLLLLPGAVLAQVRSIVAQGSAVLGDVNPFEGILRSIIAIFLIPGSFLVINYGIDVANSLTYTIADEYHRMFGSDMYEDAKCAIIRACPIQKPQNNRNAIEPPIQAPLIPNDVWSPYESWDLTTRLHDPCVPVDESRLPDEDVNASMMINRLLFNGTIASLGLTWNIYTAFQMVFLYYLWCMGPVASALWVWPIPRLRQAFGSWVEGVIILCFWALFWNTSIFLLAAFKGIGDSGTVYTAALVFLCVQSVKSAFDFVSLVSSAAQGAQSMASQAASQFQNAISSAGKDKGGAGPQNGQMPARAPAGGQRSPSAPSSTTGSAPQSISSASSSPVGREGLSRNLSVSPAPMSVSATSPGTGAGAGPSGGGTGSGPGGAALDGGNATGPGGANPSGVGPPPGSAGADGQGGKGGDGQGGQGQGGQGQGQGGGSDLHGAAAAALGGAVAGLGGRGGGDGTSLSNAAYSMSKNINNMGGDLMGGDLSQMANRLGDQNLLGNLAREGANQLGLPPMAGNLAGNMTDSISNAAMNQAGNALFGEHMGEGLHAGHGGHSIPGVDALTRGPDGLFGHDITGGFPSAADRNPLAKDLALDQVFNSGSQHDILANGLDRDVAGHPQADLARSYTQDLMRATGVDDGMLNRALQGNQQDINAIENKLGVSPMNLELARGGDPGAAALTMEAAGRNAVEHARMGDNAPMQALQQARDGGNLAAAEALNITAIPLSADALQQREQLLHQAAVQNNPDAARQLLSSNGEHVVASMSASQTVQQELNQAGVSPEQFRQALGGDQQAQQQISNQMGGVSFDKVASAYYGDTGDAATTMVARGNREIQQMQEQGMSNEQIRAQAIQSGDASILSAQAVQQSGQQGVYERALAGDQGAQRELQTTIGSSPAMLEAVHAGGSQSQARLAVEGMTGQNAITMANASHSTQGVLTQMTGDAGAVQQALNGTPQQRESFVNDMARELKVEPRVLNEALSGGSLESGTVLARAGQCAEFGMRGGEQSVYQHRLTEGLQQGGSLMTAASATYNAVTHGGHEMRTLDGAAKGENPSYGVAVGTAIQQSQELRSMASGGEYRTYDGQVATAGGGLARDAGSLIQGTSSVTHSAGQLQQYTVSDPTASLHNASITAQNSLREVGVDPQAVVTGIRNGDNTELNRAATTLGVSPDVVQGALMRGDGGDAVTMVGAAGRHMLSQGPEAVQRYSQDPQAQLSMHVAQSVPQGSLTQAMAGNASAQAQIAQSVASDPQVLASAGKNEYSFRAVGSTLGEGTSAAVAASTAAQEMIKMHPDSALVSNVLHGQGAQQQQAIQHMARDMGVSPQVVSNALSGSSQDATAMVAASANGVQQMHDRNWQGHGGYFTALSQASSDYNQIPRIENPHGPLAHAIQTAGNLAHPHAVQLASQGVPGAQEAIRATMQIDPGLGQLARSGNTAAEAIARASQGSSFGEVIRDVGIAAAAGSAIVHNLSHPHHGHHPHYQGHYDRPTGYDQFVGRAATQQYSQPAPSYQPQPQPQPHHYDRAQQHYDRGPDPIRHHDAPTGPRHVERHDPPAPTARYDSGGHPSYVDQTRPGEPIVKEAGGMSGLDAMRPTPPDSMNRTQIDSQNTMSRQSSDTTHIANAGGSPTSGWFDDGKRADAPQGPKLSDATSGAAPAIVPTSGSQNRSLTPQAWQASQTRDRKAAEEKSMREKMRQLEEQARLAQIANDQDQYEEIQKRLEAYRKHLDGEA